MKLTIQCMLEQETLTPTLTLTRYVDAKAYSLARLREVGNRLHAPELSHAFSFWAAETRELLRLAELESLERQSKSV